MIPGVRESERVAREALARRRHGDTSVLEFELVLLRPDGSRVIVEMNSIPLENEGHVQALFGVFLPARELPPLPGGDPELTPRQIEVLRHLAAGSSTAQIGERLGVSTETVRNHVRDLLKRLDVHSRIEAVAVARQRGIV